MASLPRDTITHYEYDGKGNINITITDLIRCKDCKFCEKDEIFGGSWCRGYRVRDDHFCGYASRREGEEE